MSYVIWVNRTCQGCYVCTINMLTLSYTLVSSRGTDGKTVGLRKIVTLFRSYVITLSSMTPHHITFQHITSRHVTSRYITLHHIISRSLKSVCNNITNISSLHVTPPHVTSHLVTSHRVIVHHHTGLHHLT